MAINQNHQAEELNGVKCAVVEKNLSSARAAFLKKLLEYNQFTVELMASPAPKTTPPPAPTTDAKGDLDQPIAEGTSVPETFTLGVTDLMFNTTNAIFGRLLRTPTGEVVTLAYWQERDPESHDEIPYFEKSEGSWGGRK
jgi:hypothetical protein